MKYKLILLLICLSFSILKASEAKIDTESIKIFGAFNIRDNISFIQCVTASDSEFVKKTYIINDAAKHKLQAGALYDLRVKILENLNQVTFIIKIVEIIETYLPIKLD